MIKGNLFSADVQSNLVGVRVFDDGETATLSGTVSANIIRPDGGTVAATGTFSGNECSVVLPAAAYAYPGVATIVIKLTDSGVVTTLLAVVVTIYRTSTDTAVDPGTIIPSIQTLLDQIDAAIASVDAAIASIPADYSSLWTTLAPAYTSLTFPVKAWQYCTNGGVFYRAKQDIATSEEFTSSHWDAANIGNDLCSLKSALNADEVNIYKSNAGLILSRSDIHYANGEFETNSSETYNCYLCEVKEGDAIVITGEGGNDFRLYALLGAIDTSTNNAKVINASSAGATANGQIIIIPSGVKYFAANTKKSVSHSIYHLEGIISEEQRKLSDERLGDLIGRNLDWKNSTFIASTNGAVSDATNVLLMSSDYVNVNGYDFIHYSALIATSNAIAAVSFYDSNKAYIANSSVNYTAESYTVKDKEVAVPTNAYYARFSYFAIESNESNVFYCYGKTNNPVTAKNKIDIANLATIISTVVHNLAAEYDPTAVYKVDDYCIKNNLLYRCIYSPGTAESWAIEHWTPVTAGAELLKVAKMFAPEYATGQTYAVGDYCIRNNKFYRRIYTEGTPDTIWYAPFWTEITVASELLSIKSDIDDMADDIEDLQEKIGVDDNITDIVIPSKIDTMHGHELDIYYDTLSRFEGNEGLYQINFTNLEYLLRNEYCAKIYALTQEPTCTLTIRRINKYTGATAETKTVQVNINSTLATTQTKRICIVGDSITYNDNQRIATETFRLLRADEDVTVQEIGTVGVAGGLCEGRGGWSWGDYTSSASGQNPFWDGTNNRLDFKKYCSANGFTGIDYVLINLGTNDLNEFATSAFNTMESVQSIINKAKTFIDALLSSETGYPDCKVAIALIQIGPNYWGDVKGNSARNRMNFNTLNAAFLDNFDDGKYKTNVTCFPVNVMNNRIYGFNYSEQAISSRFSQTCLAHDSNGIHPNTAGYKALADAYYFKIRTWLTEDSES
jgi:lysophospholipase L1-like esterase